MDTSTSGEARAIKQSIVATALADVEQRLRAVRCPIDGRPLTTVRLKDDRASRFDLDGCCGALAEARRALAD
jgi:hypothetical protein